MSILRPLAGLALLFVLSSCASFSGGRTADRAPLKVMSYNIRYDSPDDGRDRWENRRDLLVSQIEFHHPDVLGTQEVLSNQLRYLRRNLEGYDYVGIGREGGDDGEYSALFYDENKLRLEDSGTFWLSPTSGRVSTGWDAALPRIVTWARFRRRDTRESFMAFNTHFDHRGDQARIESAKLLVNMISQLNRDRLPVVVTGDLNLTPDTEAIGILTDYLRDAYAQAPIRLGPEGTFTGFNYEEPARNRIDYIMTSPEVRTLRAAILTDAVDGRYPSDHFPVVAEVVLP